MIPVTAVDEEEIEPSAKADDDRVDDKCVALSIALAASYIEQNGSR